MNLGIAFQIVDDVLDYSANQEKLGKTIGDDFREGKMTAPVLFAIENADEEEKSFWARVIGDNNKNDNDLGHAISLMQNHDTLERSMTLARDYAAKAEEALSIAPDGELRNMLSALITFTIEREY